MTASTAPCSASAAAVFISYNSAHKGGTLYLMHESSGQDVCNIGPLLFEHLRNARFIGWAPRLSGGGHQIVPEKFINHLQYENTMGAQNPNALSYTVLTPATLKDLSDTGDIISNVQADIDLYVQWIPLPPPACHAITYFGNDAGGPLEHQSVWCGADVYGHDYWNSVIHSYSNDYVKAITDTKYGSFASDHIVRALQYYSDHKVWGC